MILKNPMTANHGEPTSHYVG